jgi:L-2-amino-thiazoline-4-carboxylic acid hydrolase
MLLKWPPTYARRKGDVAVSELHPFYEAHRSEMEASMRLRLDLIEDLLHERLGLTDTASIKNDVMKEFDVVLTQMPYVGGAESRMSDFFMRLLGFMAIGRVMHRRGVSKDVIAELELESFKRHMLTVPEAERLEAGRKFLSDSNKALIREQAEQSREQKYPGDFVYDYVEPGPNDTFEFGVNYRSCGFCKFAGRHGDLDILPHICGLDFAAYDLRGIRLERTQTLAQGAPYCNFRFSLKPPVKSES